MSENTLLGRVLELCDKENLSVAALERECGLGNGTIKKWANAVPSGDRLNKVAKRFGVTLDYLVNGDEAITTTATHRDGVTEWTEEEKEKIEEYKQLLLAARKNRI